MTDEKKGMSKGCLIALIIGLVILFIVVALSVICIVFKDEIKGAVLERLTETVATEIKNNLPDGITADEVDSLMKEFKDAYASDKISQEDLGQVSSMVSSMMSDKKIDKDEAKELLDKLHEVLK